MGVRSLSATLDNAVAAYLFRLRHLHAVDEWLNELERDHGPVPLEMLAWATEMVDGWSDSDQPASPGGLMLLLDSEAISASLMVPPPAGIASGLL